MGGEGVQMGFRGWDSRAVGVIALSLAREGRSLPHQPAMELVRLLSAFDVLSD